MKRFAVVTTSLGDLGLVGSERGLSALILPGSDLRGSLRQAAGAGGDGVEDPAFFAGLADRLRRYSQGKAVSFDDVVLDIVGTPFQRAVWQATHAIPWGETRTYGQLARGLGRPGAARAVGAAEAANPVPIIVPCHRVVGSGGSLCGFGGGLPLKMKLLALETRLLSGA